eukprot:4486072-Pyramimonas_sp.AAC.1
MATLKELWAERISEMTMVEVGSLVLRRQWRRGKGYVDGKPQRSRLVCAIDRVHAIAPRSLRSSRT